MKYLRHFVGVTILHWERNQSVRDKVGVRNIVREIEQYIKKNRTYKKRDIRTGTAIINLKGGEISNDRVNDEGTNFTARVKEQALCLTLQSPWWCNATAYSKNIFFHWHYSPLWAVACQTMSFHFFLSANNSLHLLTPSTSSSIGTTAHCGLWPVELCPSNFSYLPPTLSIFSLPALKISFYFLFPSFPGSSPSSSAFQFSSEDLFWASYPPLFSLGDLTSLSFAL